MFFFFCCQVFLQPCNSFFNSCPGTATNLGNDQPGVEFFFCCHIMVNGLWVLLVAPQSRSIWLGWPFCYTFWWHTSSIALNLNRIHKPFPHDKWVSTWRGYIHIGRFLLARCPGWWQHLANRSSKATNLQKLSRLSRSSSGNTVLVIS